jgi:1-deoxy-D-xylulose-5-phosphate synthase
MVGADGPTHAGVFDVAFLRCLPNVVLMTPSNQADCRDMLTTAFNVNGPSVVRYPRGAGMGPEASQALETITIGKGLIVRKIKNTEAARKKIAFVCFGPLLYNALPVAEELDATVADMRFVKPLDEALLLDLAKNHDALVFVEDSAIQGGAGSACLEALSSHQIQIATLQIGIPDEYVEHGDINALLDLYGLSSEKILSRVRDHFQP